MMNVHSKNQLKILELFAGSRSVGKIAEQRGHKVFSVDIKPFEKIDLVKDINELNADDVPFIPDLCIAGTPCTTYSICAISHHRGENFKPKSEFAQLCDDMNVRLLKLFRYYESLNPDFVWFIENPRGALRKMWFMQNVPRTTVWYCQYNDPAKRAKPTDVWSNHLYSLFNEYGWQSRPVCKNSNPNCDHEKAPRGSKTGTQGLKGNYERSIYPPELCVEWIESVERKISI
jgi:site-specific DNA-cytosine methylase